MTLKEKLDQDLKEALKSKDEIRLSVIRMVKTGVKNKEVELIQALDDTQVMQVLSKLAKQAEESIEQFENGGRSDLADRERLQLKVIQAYLPQQMTEAEIQVHVEEAIRETGATNPKDFGKVMKVLMPKLTGRADGKVVSGLLQKLLQPK